MKFSNIIKTLRVIMYGAFFVYVAKLAYRIYKTGGTKKVETEYNEPHDDEPKYEQVTAVAEG